jgi:hypothetical protein
MSQQEQRCVMALRSTGVSGRRATRMYGRYAAHGFYTTTGGTPTCSIIGRASSPWGDWQSTLDRPPGPLSSRNASLGELLSDPATRAILSRELPELTSEAANSERLATLSLWLIQQFGLMQIPDAKLEVIDRQLAASGG